MDVKQNLVLSWEEKDPYFSVTNLGWLYMIRAKNGYMKIICEWWDHHISGAGDVIVSVYS